MPLDEKDEEGTSARDQRLETERMIEETRRMLENTCAFLKCIREGEDAANQYVQQLKGTLENDLRRLERDRMERERRDGKEPQPHPAIE